MSINSTYMKKDLYQLLNFDLRKILMSSKIISVESTDTKSVRSTALQQWNLDWNKKSLLFLSIILFF